ncbi:Hypothetical predicted protein, partial [Podarcis lilfordi]
LPRRTQRALSVAIAVGYDFHKDKKTLLTLLSSVSIQQQSTRQFSPRKRGTLAKHKQEKESTNCTNSQQHLFHRSGLTRHLIVFILTAV